MKNNKIKTSFVRFKGLKAQVNKTGINLIFVWLRSGSIQRILIGFEVNLEIYKDCNLVKANKDRNMYIRLIISALEQTNIMFMSDYRVDL